MLLDDLKRRGVLRAGATYTVAALGLWGAVDLGAEALALPESVLRYTVIATVSGLPLVLVLAWFFNLRIERDTPLSPSDHPRIMGALAAGVGVAAVIFFVLSSATDVSSGNPPTVPGFEGRAAVAVLPFDDRSADGGNRHLADGIAEEILTSLQAWGVFPVISRGSTFAFRGPVDIPTVATDLGVRYVLEGSVDRSGESIRVTSRLIDARTDTQLWADRFDGTLGDVFELQDRITERIATAIAPEITRSEMQRASAARPTNLAAWELVMRAQALILEGTLEATSEAEALLHLALEREPGYGVAHARLAEIRHDESNNLSIEVGHEAAVAAMDEALVNARRAVEVAPGLVDGRIWYGHLLMHHRRITEGVEQLREAVRLNSSHAQARAELGFGLAILGQVDAAMDEFRLAERLSPNDPRNQRIKTFEALAHLYAGDNDRAVSTAHAVILAQPESPITVIPYVVEISGLVREGRLDSAQERVAAFLETHGALDWPAIERGAWSEEELARVRGNMVAVGLIER